LWKTQEDRGQKTGIGLGRGREDCINISQTHVQHATWAGRRTRHSLPSDIDVFYAQSGSTCHSAESVPYNTHRERASVANRHKTTCQMHRYIVVPYVQLPQSLLVSLVCFGCNFCLVLLCFLPFEAKQMHTCICFASTKIFPNASTICACLCIYRAALRLSARA